MLRNTGDTKQDVELLEVVLEGTSPETDILDVLADGEEENIKLSEILKRMNKSSEFRDVFIWIKNENINGFKNVQHFIQKYAILLQKNNKETEVLQMAKIILCLQVLKTMGPDGVTTMIEKINERNGYYELQLATQLLDEIKKIEAEAKKGDQLIFEEKVKAFAMLDKDDSKAFLYENLEIISEKSLKFLHSLCYKAEKDHELEQLAFQYFTLKELLEMEGELPPKQKLDNFSFEFSKDRQTLEEAEALIHKMRNFMEQVKADRFIEPSLCASFLKRYKSTMKWMKGDSVDPDKKFK